MAPKRVLQVVVNMNAGGIENMLMNLYRNLDRDKIQFDFLFHTDEKSFFEEEILSLGGKIHRINPLRFTNLPRYLNSLNDFFSEHKYQIVHSHISVWSYFILSQAKKNNVPYRIAHSHEAHETIWEHRAHRIPFIFTLRQVINKPLTHRFACGQAAGKWLFGNNDFKVINNAIDSDKFSYNQSLSNKMKIELGLENNIIFGHVGRFNRQKNHEFLIDIFEAIKKIEPSAKLLLVGDGDLKSKIERIVKEKQLDNDILFLGIRKDVNNLLQAIDYILMPSFFEGLPVSLIEAQAGGIKIFASNNISEEVDLTGNIHFIPIDDGVNPWIEEYIQSKDYNRKVTKQHIEEANYDIFANAKLIQDFYLSLIK